MILSKRLLTILSILLLVSCGGGGGGGEAGTPDTPLNCSVASQLPPIPSASGQYVFSVPATVNACSVSAYVVGYRTALTAERVAGGRFAINNVPAGRFDVVVVGSLGATASARESPAAVGDGRGARIKGAQSLAGVRTDAGEITLEPLASISGTVLLSGATDHSGIDVYIPGTDFVARSDAAGMFSFSAVPPGEHNLFLERSGYYRGQIEALVVAPGQAKLAPDVRLILSTGATGYVSLAAGSARFNSRTVPVVVAATPDAVLMKLSENSSFVNIDWTPLVTTTNFTFTGDGTRTLYVAFANSNGLPSSPYSASILIDTSRPTVTALSPVPPPGKTVYYSGISTASSVDFSISASDGDGTGIEQYKIYQLGQTPPSEWQQFSNGAASLGVSGYATGACTVVRDGFGQVSDPYCIQRVMYRPLLEFPTGDTVDSQCGGGPDQGYRQVAQSFRLDASALVSGVQYGLYYVGNTAVSIRADAAGIPGTIIADFPTEVGAAGKAGMNMGTDNRGWSFTRSVPIQLNGGVTYWIVAAHVTSPGNDPNGNVVITSENYTGGVALRSVDGMTWTAFSHPCGTPSDIPFALF